MDEFAAQAMRGMGMAWKGGFTGEHFSVEAFKDYVEQLPLTWRPKGIVIHNTDAPNLAQARATKGGFPQRVRNIAPHYKNQGWSSGPHLFVFEDRNIYTGTPLKEKGTHSPSWNGTYWGLEMVADFDIGQDDDDAGPGLAVKEATCWAVAILLDKLGLPANNDTVKLHKEDPRTTHRCPGADIVKADMLERIATYLEDLSPAGDHGDVDTPPAKPRPGVVNTNELNLRDTPGMAGKVVVPGGLAKGTKLLIYSSAKNGVTEWFRVTVPMTTLEGWVAARYVNEPSEVPVPTPAPTPQPEAPKPVPTPPKPEPVTPVVTPPIALPVGGAWFEPKDFKFSEFLVLWMKSIEGLRLKAYWDKNDWAIGYGHNNSSKRPPAVYESTTLPSQAEAEKILRMDIEAYAVFLRKLIKVPLQQQHIDGLVLCMFRQGPTQFGKGEVCKHVNAKEFWSAAKKLRDHPTTNAGLKRRYMIEYRIFNGEKPEPGKW
jgi:GH24 family phage-related lysozyme (muramidase)